MSQKEIQELFCIGKRNYTLWTKTYFQHNWYWSILIPIEILGHFQTCIGVLPMSFQEKIHDSFSWLTNMPWYWHVIAIMLLAHLIFMNNANKIYQKDMKQKDQEMDKLKDIIINRKKQDDLAIKLQSLLTAYNETGGLPNSWNVFYNGVKQAINDSDLLVISKATIIEFENANNIPQIKNLCVKMINQLQWKDLD